MNVCGTEGKLCSLSEFQATPLSLLQGDTAHDPGLLLSSTDLTELLANM